MGDANRWVWRTPLGKSQPYWEGWYRGLSEAFLQVWGEVWESVEGSAQRCLPEGVGYGMGGWGGGRRAGTEWVGIRET